MSARAAAMIPDGTGRWIDWMGSPVQLLAAGEDTGGAYTIETGTVDIGDGPVPHVQSREDEGFYVLRGKVEFEAGTATVRAEAGDFVNIRSGTAHSLTNVGLEEAELLVINAPAGFEALQLEVGKEVDDVFDAYDPEPELLEKLTSSALDYGIEIDPGEHAFELPPQITVRHKDEGETVNAVGDRYRFLVESDDTNGRYALWHATVGPGGGPPPHKHSKEEEAFYVLSGEIWFEADGQEATLGPGGFVNLPRGSAHRFANRGDEPAEMLVIVAPAGLEKMFRKTGRVVTADDPIDPPSGEEIERLHAIAPDFGIELLDG